MSTRRFAPVQRACQLIGGDDKPISRATYYRGVKDGRYPPPVKVAPNISRVDLDVLDEYMAKIGAE